MTERDPQTRPPRPPEAAEGMHWDLPTLAAALDATPEPTEDLFFGAGTGFRLGPERATHLALYPAHGAVELTTPDLVISFRRPAAEPLLALVQAQPHQRGLAVDRRLADRQVVLPVVVLLVLGGILAFGHEPLIAPLPVDHAVWLAAASRTGA